MAFDEVTGGVVTVKVPSTPLGVLVGRLMRWVRLVFCRDRLDADITTVEVVDAHTAALGLAVRAEFAAVVVAIAVANDED